MTNPISNGSLGKFSLEFIDDHGWSRILTLNEGDTFHGGLLTNTVKINQTNAVSGGFFVRPLDVFENVLKKIFRVAVVSEQTPEGPHSKIVYNFSPADEMPQALAQDAGPVTLKMDPADVARLAKVSGQLHEASPVPLSHDAPTLYLPQDDMTFLMKTGTTGQIRTVNFDLRALAAQEGLAHAESIAPTMVMESPQPAVRAELPRLQLVEVLDDDTVPPQRIMPPPRPSKTQVPVRSVSSSSRIGRSVPARFDASVSLGLNFVAILLGFGFTRLMEWKVGRELEPYEKLISYGSFGLLPVGIGAAVAGGIKPWQLTRTLRATPVGIAGSFAGGTAVNVSGQLLGFDMDSWQGELSSGLGGAFLGTASAEATIGGASAATAGLTLTGFGIGLLSGLAVAGSAVGGVFAGTVIDRQIGSVINESGDDTLSEVIALELHEDPWLFAFGTVLFGTPVGPAVYGYHRLYDWYMSKEEIIPSVY